MERLWLMRKWVQFPLIAILLTNLENDSVYDKTSIFNLICYGPQLLFENIL